MNDVLALLIVLLAVSYAASRIYRVLKGADDPCSNCDGCALKGAKNGKAQCDKKK